MSIVKFLNSLFFYHSVKKKEFEFDNVILEKNPDRVLEALKKYGVVIINNFISHQDAETAKVKLLDWINKIDINQNSGDMGEFILNNNKFTFQEILAFNKPVMNIRDHDRNKVDGGMIDIFKVNELFKNANGVDKIFKKMHASYDKVFSSFKDTTFSSFNLYYNHSVTNPRGAHIDHSDGNEFKCFLYLTDVLTISHGPYSYVPKSHKKLFLLKLSTFFQRLANKFIKQSIYRYDDMQVNDKLTMPLLGVAGTLIISNQSGIHGGAPQENGFERLVLVDSYRNNKK